MLLGRPLPYWALGRRIDEAVTAATINSASVVEHVDTQTGLLRRHELDQKAAARNEQFEDGHIANVLIRRGVGNSPHFRKQTLRDLRSDSEKPSANRDVGSANCGPARGREMGGASGCGSARNADPQPKRSPT
jgi:hypothetical protein